MTNKSLFFCSPIKTWSLKPQKKNLHILSFDVDRELFTVHIEKGGHRYQFHLKTGQHWKMKKIYIFLCQCMCQVKSKWMYVCLFFKLQCKGLTIFFDLKLCRVALLWVTVELRHHLPHSGTTHKNTYFNNQANKLNIHNKYENFIVNSVESCLQLHC